MKTHKASVDRLIYAAQGNTFSLIISMTKGQQEPKAEQEVS